MSKEISSSLLVLFPVRFDFCFLCHSIVRCHSIVEWVFIQLLCMTKYVSFSIEMYGLCVCVSDRKHSRCMGLVLCSFRCCMDERFKSLNGVSMLCVWLVGVGGDAGDVVFVVIMFAVWGFAVVIGLLLMHLLPIMRSLLLSIMAVAAVFSHIWAVGLHVDGW